MSGSPIALPLIAGFAASIVATGAARRWALRAGSLDPAEPGRRLHETPTPRVGGVGIAAGAAVGGAVAAATGALHAAAWRVAIVVGAAFLVGLVDDLFVPRGRALSARSKLALQVAIAAAAVLLGARVDGRAFAPWGEMSLGALSPVLTAAWIVAVVNVVNFMDGSDGIAATIAIVVLSSAASQEPDALAGVVVPLAAATLGFLVWNAPPARIFMGDGGSHLLGAALALAPCSIGPAGASASPGAPWPLVGAALVPAIVDVVEALVHKVRHRIPMSRAHHDHLYQRLVRADSPPGVVALRYGTLALLGLVVAGPVSRIAGVAGACAMGAGILAAHWLDGIARTRHVPRISGRRREGGS